MMNRLASGCAALGIVAVICGCGGGGKLKVDLDQVTNDDYCAKVAEVVCHNIFICCTGNQIENTFGLTITTNESQCRRDVELRCEQKNYLLLHAIDKGTATILEDKAPACLQSFLVSEERGCFVYAPETPWSTACKEPVYKGLQAAGGACFSSVECTKDHYCALDRKCKALPKPGEPCPALVCVEGSFCNLMDGKCTALKGKGQECLSTTECAEDHVCKMGTGTNPIPTCEPLGKLGEPCAGNDDCESAYCIPGLCSDGKSCYSDDQCVGICETDPTKKCMDDLDCPGKCSVSADPCSQDYDCPYGETCNRTCTPSPCQGNPACGEKLSLVDYCIGPMALIGSSPSPNP